MNARALNALAGVISAAMRAGRQTPMGIAFAVESAGLMQSPETAAEWERYAALDEVPLLPECRAQSCGHQGVCPTVLVSVAVRDVLDGVLDRAERVAELETFAHGCDAEGCVLPHSSWCERAKKTAAENDGCTCGQPWKDHPQPHAGHCWLLSPPRAEVERLRARAAELEQHTTTDLTVYRASHDSIAMGLYTTATEARAHCEAEERRCWPGLKTLPFVWIEDEEDGTAELVIDHGDEETETGYVVTALAVQAAYAEGDGHR